MKSKITLLLFLGFFNLYAQAPKKLTPARKEAPAAIQKIDTSEGIFATIATSKGNIILALYYTKTPITVANFISLAEGKNPFVTIDKLKGKAFYDGLKFHRVINDFMIQGGDPNGDGSGAPGYAFKDEITDSKFDRAGLLAMANSGPATNGSQFFITHKDTGWLNGKHTIYGEVIQGMDVVNAIVQNDVINKITISRKGAAAKKFNAEKVFSDYFKNKDKDAKLQAEKEEKERTAARDLALKQFPNANSTADGLKYIVLQEGTGALPNAQSNVKVHYTASFLNGTVFDSSIQRGEPLDLNLGQVIPGWKEAVQLMKEGSKYKFFIPYQLAYGERGYPGAIPPKSDLIFEIELLKINQ